MHPENSYVIRHVLSVLPLLAALSATRPGFMRPFVARSLQRTRMHRPRARALELGCGMDALSCQLAEAAFDVTGVNTRVTRLNVRASRAGCVAVGGWIPAP